MATDRLPPDTPWYWRLETSEWERRIQGLAKRMFHSEPGVVEVAVEHARREALAKASAGGVSLPSNPDAFLLTLLKRALMDFSKQRYGYRRPPVWVQRLGRIWEAVYHLLCVLKRAPEEIGAEPVQRRLGRRAQKEEAEQATEGMVREAIREILRREHDCRQPKAPSIVSLDASANGDADDAAAAPVARISQPHGAVHETLDREAVERVLGVLRAILAEDVEAPEAPAEENPSERTMADLAAFAKYLELSDRERLVLRLIYQEGLSARAAARALNEGERSVQRLKNRALKKIAAAFARAGLDDPLSALSLL